MVACEHVPIVLTPRALLRVQQNENASREVAEMIREIFVALMLLSLTVSLVAWYSAGSGLSVQQVEASMAR